MGHRRRNRRQRRDTRGGRSAHRRLPGKAPTQPPEESGTPMPGGSTTLTPGESPTLTPPIAVPNAPPSHSAETWWHCLPADEAIARLGSDARGLSDAEAAQRLAHTGYNEIEPSQQTATLQLLLSQFSNILILILLVATAVSAYLGHEVEAVVIAVIVLFAVILGFVQEFRAERAMDALRKMAAPTATVIRGGQSREVAARSLVPGDIVQLQTGNRIPADLRLIEAVNLRTDEAALTGESTPIDKDSGLAIPGTAAIGERHTMAYAGTVVTYGRGSGVVVATGMDTEFGRIVRLLRRATPRRTPLQQNLDKAGRSLAIAALVIVAVIVAQGVLRGESFIQMLVFGIALAVAVVPEALPAVVTISLALGAHRMIRRNALIRRLPAVETLGCTSVICSDKTGTLTKDEMTVRKIWTADRLATLSGTGYEPFGWLLCSGERVARSSTEERLLRAATLASDARLTRGAGDRWQMKGDPTEGALVVAAAKLGLDRSELDTRYPRIGEIPFTSESKRMTTLHRTEDGGTLACSKGAVEVILEACGTLLGEAGERELDEDQRTGILEQAHELAAQALRVLAVAERRDVELADTDHDLVFLGLVGMIDPPRPESRAAVERCEAAGIRVIMITGDHPSTAQAVARELGILRRGRIVTGPEIDEMSGQDFARQVGDFDVYARVSPEHKLRVVDALQRQGHIVAMTGDGVNDAPALKQADIGIAMGIAGTDVSREAAAMTLIDDNFASIVAAVEEGRGIFNNIKKYLMYLLAANIGEIGLIGAAAALGLPMPLSAVQILYVNLATDGLPALALAMDPNDAALMQQKPRDPRTGIFNRAVVALMLAGGLWSMAVNLALFEWAVTRPEHGVDRAMTIVFAALVLTEFFKAFSYRSYDRPISRRPFGNRWLNLAILWELGLLVSLLYVPPLQRLFGTVPLDLNDWAVLAASAFSIVPLLELVKWTLRRAGARRDEHG